MDVTLLTNDHQDGAAPEPVPSSPPHSPLGHHRATVFDSEVVRADAAALAQLEDGVLDADLAAPPVVLPDFHHKHNMEMPSSIAVATTGTIRPTLTSSSVNCGMALLAFDIQRPDQPAVTEFFDRVRSRYPYPTTHRRDLDTADVLRCAAEGGRFAVDRWGIDPDELCRVEEDACLPVEPFGGARRLRRELPISVRQLSRQRFGTVGPTNHFVELQQVEEVFDPEVASILGVAAGQVTLQYHAGGGVLAGEVGRMFGRRRDYPRIHRMQMAVEKPRVHLATARSMRELRNRWRLYFSGGCPAVPRHSSEGERMMLANAAAMNYGFAFRLATYASLRRIADEVFGQSGSRLVVDSPHNSIYEEQVAGQTALVHRHNSCRAYPADLMAGNPVFGRTGQAVLLPGTNRTSSYLCVAGDRAASSLHSACHGAGTMVSDLLAKGRSGPDPAGRSTLRFSYSDAAPEELAHHDDKGVDEALGILVHHGLVRPVARLRPFAGLN